MTTTVAEEDNNLQITDLEAQQTPLGVSNQCPGSCIATCTTVKLPWNLSLDAVLYFAAVLVPVCAMFVPMFLSDRIHEISTMGVLGEALRTSTRLVIAESISIGCTLPVLSDMFVDRITVPASRRAETMSLSMRHRLLLTLTFLGTSVLYISLSDRYFMAFLYIILNRTK
eukprot:gene41643-55216_t